MAIADLQELQDFVTGEQGAGRGVELLNTLCQKVCARGKDWKAIADRINGSSLSEMLAANTEHGETLRVAMRHVKDGTHWG